MERLVALAGTGAIGPEQVRECLPRSTEDPVTMALPPDGVDLEGVIAAIERDFLLKALQRTHGVKKDAASLLGLDFRSFRYRLSNTTDRPRSSPREACRLDDRFVSRSPRSS
jgi:two-component system response regulator PilR (NtrC family)